MKFTVGLEEEDLSEEAKDLLQKMLAKEPLERATMECILRHPWVTKTI
jgi:serine/threonine protein kinase